MTRVTLLWAPSRVSHLEFADITDRYTPEFHFCFVANRRYKVQKCHINYSSLYINVMFIYDMFINIGKNRYENEIMENIIFEELRPRRCAQRNNAPLFLRQSLNADSEPWLCSHWAVVFLSEAPESGAATAKKTSQMSCAFKSGGIALRRSSLKSFRSVLMRVRFLQLRSVSEKLHKTLLSQNIVRHQTRSNVEIMYNEKNGISIIQSQCSEKNYHSIEERNIEFEILM